MRILVLNSGSSSVKFAVLELSGSESRALVSGEVTGIGGASKLELKEGDRVVSLPERPMSDHAQAVHWVLESLEVQKLNGDERNVLASVKAVGHRIVHGGDRFQGPVRIDDGVLKQIEVLSPLAPLHNPACVAGIKTARKALGNEMTMVAVFDTAFHHGMPLYASTYAIPRELAARHAIRRYGFHGIAHAALARNYAKTVGMPLDRLRLITLQLGNGASATAIRNGQSIDTSMGFTPLEGLVMGTRSGDLDPAVVAYLVRTEKLDADEVERVLNERSGLLGVSGCSHDMRELLNAVEDHDSAAELAVDLFCYRARKYLGAYLAVLGGADAVIFGGGIGENSPEIRARICAGMAWCGLTLDEKRNAVAIGLREATRIHSDAATIQTYVIPADEERAIAEETARYLETNR